MNMNNPNRIAHVNTDWTPSVRALICSCSDAGGLLRKLMSTSEIHLANKLIKQRLMISKALSVILLTVNINLRDTITTPLPLKDAR